MGIFLNLEENLVGEYKEKFIKNDNQLELEAINEFKIFEDDGISIAVDSTIGRNGYYFKVYNNRNYAKATKVARIDVEKADYVYHRSDGKSIWDMNKSELRSLISILNSPITGGSSVTIWDKILEACNEFKPNPKLSNLEMPDYMEIKFDKAKGNKFK